MHCLFGTEYPTTLVETGVYQTVVALPVGNYTVNATVSNDPKYADKTSDSKDFEVAKNSTYEIGLDVVPGVDGNDTVITVTVPEDVTGNVTININGTEYPTVKVNDTTYVAEIPLAPGNYTVNATVSNDPKYADKTSDNEEFNEMLLYPTIQSMLIKLLIMKNSTFLRLVQMHTILVWMLFLVLMVMILLLQ